MSLHSTATANDKVFPKTEVDRMELKTIPASRLIVSGSSGHYFSENHPTHKASGEARGIFWNGPFTPGFLKRFEVHLPVVERSNDGN